MEDLFKSIESMPLIAILRGIKPEEIDAVSDALYSAGFKFVEITLNSPHWNESLGRLVNRHGDTMVVGAGTVLTTEQVHQVHKLGCKVIISPNLCEKVVKTSKDCGLISVPGCYTPSECFKALEYGADILKIFPAETLGVPFIKAISAVLPDQTRICPTGGITTDNMHQFINAGVYAMGMGSSLYKPAKSTADIETSARKLVNTYLELR